MPFVVYVDFRFFDRVCVLVIIVTHNGLFCSKLLLPSIAALPLLMAYAGRTNIVIPKPLRSTVGLTELDLGKY